MASITIGCPDGGDHVQVTAGSGSCGTGTICVHGTCAEALLLRVLKFIIRLLVRFFRWIFRLKPVPQRRLTGLTGLTIRVRVVNGTVTTDPLHYPKLPCDVDTPASPDWCARPVWVPEWSGSGAPLTVFAWLLSGLSSGNGTVEAGPDRSNFYGGGPYPRDCCANCPSSSAFEKASLASELATHPRLEVAVPDGPHAGLHRATAVSYLTWAATIHGVTYEVSCDRGGALILRGPSASSPATSVEDGPFSATFPGAVFGAVGDVVVTKA
jgi:hypothetical protein